MNGEGRIARGDQGGPRRAAAGAQGPHRLPRSAQGLLRRVRPARRLVPAAARLLGAVRRARPRPPGRDRRRRGLPVRGQRHRGRAGDPVQHRDLPARDHQRTHKGFGVPAADALAYGVILQAVEIATAVALGVPALVREGVTWSDMRLRAMSAAPVQLSERPPARETRATAPARASPPSPRPARLSGSGLGLDGRRRPARPPAAARRRARCRRSARRAPSPSG